MAADNEIKYLGSEGTEQIVANIKTKVPIMVNEALANAKASGDFDGADGVTPVRGIDYWTESDKAEIKSYVNEAMPNVEVVSTYIENNILVLTKT